MLLLATEFFAHSEAYSRLFVGQDVSHNEMLVEGDILSGHPQSELTTCTTFIAIRKCHSVSAGYIVLTAMGPLVRHAIYTGTEYFISRFENSPDANAHFCPFSTLQ